MEIKYVLYFFLGGTVVSLVSYFASHSKGLIAAFFANLPVITLATFTIIYFESGKEPVLEYAKSLIIMLPPWLGYIFSILFLGPKIGIIPSLLLGLACYFLLSFLIIKSFSLKF